MPLRMKIANSRISSTRTAHRFGPCESFNNGFWKRYPSHQEKVEENEVIVVCQTRFNGLVLILSVLIHAALSDRCRVKMDFL